MLSVPSARPDMPQSQRSTWHLEQPGHGEMIGRETNLTVDHRLVTAMAIALDAPQSR